MARPIAKDYGTKRRLILNQAARLFANEGFDRTSVSRVAQACEISKANVYHYYGGKDEILFDILDAYLSGLRDRIVGMDLADQTAQKRFSLTITEILLAYQGADFEHRLQANVMGHLPPKQQAILQGYQKDLVSHLSGLVSGIAPQVLRAISQNYGRRRCPFSGCSTGSICGIQMPTKTHAKTTANSSANCA